VGVVDQGVGLGRGHAHEHPGVLVEDAPGPGHGHEVAPGVQAVAEPAQAGVLDGTENVGLVQGILFIYFPNISFSFSPLHNGISLRTLDTGVLVEAGSLSLSFFLSFFSLSFSLSLLKLSNM
jgi:hypothetical protein